MSSDYLVQILSHGLESVTNEVVGQLSSVEYLSQLRQAEESVLQKKFDAPVPYICRDQEIRALLQSIQKQTRVQLNNKLNELVNSTKFKAQLQGLQEQGIARLCLSKAEIAPAEWEFWQQDNLSVDDIIEEGMIDALFR